MLNTGRNDVLVTDGADCIVDVEPGTLVWGKDVGVEKRGAGVFVRGSRRYDAVIAIDVLVLLAFRTSASLAACPPEAIQTKINRIMNRPVTPSASK